MELASTSFKRALTPSNIKVGSKQIGICLLNSDALLHDTVCIQDFDVHGNEDADVENNILSLSYGHCQPLGDNDEYVIATQYDHELVVNNDEVVVSNEKHTGSP